MSFKVLLLAILEIYLASMTNSLVSALLENERNDFCLKKKNVTFILDIVLHYGDTSSLDTLFSPLMKVLLRDSCTQVWMYSHFKKRLIQLEEENLIARLSMEEFTKIFDVNEFMEVTLANSPEGSGTKEQNIIYVYNREISTESNVKK